MRPSIPVSPQEQALRGFIAGHARIFVLTGAGCSTGSGIPDYRDGDGQWKRRPPIDFRSFMDSAAMRARYWARSLVGWRLFSGVRPNAAHAALHGLARADAMLVVGSSLMVHSGYRYARAAATAGLPLAAVNLGRTRADDLLDLKVERPCAEALAFLLPGEPSAAQAGPLPGAAADDAAAAPGDGGLPAA